MTIETDNTRFFIMEIKCPSCGSQHSIKAGKTPQGKQRYKCHNCARRFTSVTPSIFHSQKLKAKTLRHLLALIIRDATIDDMVEILGISSRTAYMWWIKAYKCLEKHQESLIFSNIGIKNSLKGLKMNDKILKLEEVCLKSGITFKIKDRY